jgi:hypothetical protein
MSIYLTHTPIIKSFSARKAAICWQVEDSFWIVQISLQKQGYLNLFPSPLSKLFSARNISQPPCANAFRGKWHGEQMAWSTLLLFSAALAVWEK